MFSLDDYRTAVALLEDRHFGRAAGRLGITQSALSVRLRRIEAAIGARLFERGRSGVEPTAAGLSFAEGARRVLEAAEEAARSAVNASLGFGETLRLGMTQVAAYQIVGPALRAFRAAQPRVRVTLGEGTTATLEAKLESRVIDIAFLHPPLHASSLSDRPLLAAPLVRLNAAGDADAPLIRFPRAEAPVLMGRLGREDDREGRPSLAKADTMTGALLLSEAGYGDCVVPGDYPQPVGGRPIDGFAGRRQATLGTSIAWRNADRRPVVQAMIEVSASAASVDH